MTQISIPLETEEFLELAQFLSDQDLDLDPVDAVRIALDYWVENAVWKEELLSPFKRSESVGGEYVWKIRAEGSIPATSVELPNGTILRLSSHGVDHDCEVRNGQLRYRGMTMGSPSQFAKAAAGHPRDAWRDLWVKRLSDRQFFPAEELRKTARKTLKPNH